jgi:predicted RNA binding protein YcfA (HicA-like mRNA interferase family)
MLPVCARLHAYEWAVHRSVPGAVCPGAQLSVRRRGDITNVDFDDLVRLVEALGFREVSGRGSHPVFAHPDVPELVNLQIERGQAKRYQVRQVGG